MSKRFNGHISWNKFLDSNEVKLKRLSQIIDDMLEDQRIRKKEFRLELCPIELRGFIKEMLVRNSGQLKIGEVIFYSGEGEIHSEWDLLSLMNLLSNAIKFGAGKQVVLQLEDDGGNAHKMKAPF